MYVERVPNRNSPPAVLLRQSWREGNKIRKRTLANLSDWPAPQIGGETGGGNWTAADVRFSRALALAGFARGEIQGSPWFRLLSERPGIGIEINEDAVKEKLEPGYEL